jgi:hypothetical protein
MRSCRWVEERDDFLKGGDPSANWTGEDLVEANDRELHGPQRRMMECLPNLGDPVKERFTSGSGREPATIADRIWEAFRQALGRSA